MLRDSVAAAAVVVVVMCTRPQAIPLAMITMRKSTHGFPFLPHDEYGAPLGGPLGRRSSAMNDEVSLICERRCMTTYERQKLSKIANPWFSLFQR